MARDGSEEEWDGRRRRPRTREADEAIPRKPSRWSPDERRGGFRHNEEEDSSSHDRYRRRSSGARSRSPTQRGSSPDKRRRMRDEATAISRDIMNAAILMQRRKNYRFDSPPRDTPRPPGGFGPEAPSGVSSSLAAAAQQMKLSAEQTKAARELYIGNLPPGIDGMQLQDFLNAAMQQTLSVPLMPGSPVVKSWIPNDGHFAFVEFRTMEEATAGMQLNGLNCLGYSLRIGRPKTYPQELGQIQQQFGTLQGMLQSSATPAIPDAPQPPAPAILPTPVSTPGRVEGVAPSGPWSPLTPVGGFSDGPAVPQRLFVMNIPVALSEDAVKEFMVTYGPLKYFQCLRKSGAQPVSAYIVEFTTLKAHNAAISALQGLELGPVPVKVSKAEDATVSGELQALLKEADGAIVDAIGGEMISVEVPTRVLMLSNILLPEELLDEVEVQEILEDIRLECSEHGGRVISLEVPRPARGFALHEIDQTDVGFAFVEFANVTAALRAKRNLSGRKFAGRIVDAHYFSEILYTAREFKNPRPNTCRSHSTLGDPKLSSHIVSDEQLEAEREAEKLQQQGLLTIAGDAMADELDGFAMMAGPGPLPPPPPPPPPPPR